MPRAKAKPSRRGPPEPGTFQPGLPNGSEELVRLFVIAARAVCSRPEGLEEVTATLSHILSQLAPPERITGDECARLWTLFGRMAQKAGRKPALLEEGARALYRDLDGIGQSLDLPPLDPWTSIPSAVRAAHPVAMMMDDDTDAGESLEAVRARARARREKKGKGGGKLRPSEVLDLIASLGKVAREDLYKNVVGQGVVSRTEVTLVEQLLAQGGQPPPKGSGGDLVLAALDNLGEWLAKAP